MSLSRHGGFTGIEDIDRETWLHEDSTNIDTEGYTVRRADHDKMSSRRATGTGLCIFIDNTWATQLKVFQGQIIWKPLKP